MKNILKIIIYAFFFCLSPVCYAQTAIVSKLSTDKECNDFNCLDANEKAQIIQYLEDIRIKTNVVINVSFFSVPNYGMGVNNGQAKDLDGNTWFVNEETFTTIDFYIIAKPNHSTTYANSRFDFLGEGGYVFDYGKTDKDLLPYPKKMLCQLIAAIDHIKSNIKNLKPNLKAINLNAWPAFQGYNCSSDPSKDLPQYYNIGDFVYEPDGKVIGKISKSAEIASDRRHLKSTHCTDIVYVIPTMIGPSLISSTQESLLEVIKKDKLDKKNALIAYIELDEKGNYAAKKIISTGVGLPTNPEDKDRCYPEFFAFSKPDFDDIATAINASLKGNQDIIKALKEGNRVIRSKFNPQSSGNTNIGSPDGSGFKQKIFLPGVHWDFTATQPTFQLNTDAYGYNYARLREDLDNVLKGVSLASNADFPFLLITSKDGIVDSYKNAAEKFYNPIFELVPHSTNAKKFAGRVWMHFKQKPEGLEIFMDVNIDRSVFDIRNLSDLETNFEQESCNLFSIIFKKLKTGTVKSLLNVSEIVKNLGNNFDKVYKCNFANGGYDTSFGIAWRNHTDGSSPTDFEKCFDILSLTIEFLPIANQISNNTYNPIIKMPDRLWQPEEVSHKYCVLDLGGFYAGIYNGITYTMFNIGIVVAANTLGAPAKIAMLGVLSVQAIFSDDPSAFFKILINPLYGTIDLYSTQFRQIDATTFSNNPIYDCEFRTKEVFEKSMMMVGDILVMSFDPAAGSFSKKTLFESTTTVCGMQPFKKKANITTSTVDEFTQAMINGKEMAKSISAANQAEFRALISYNQSIAILKTKFNIDITALGISETNLLKALKNLNESDMFASNKALQAEYAAFIEAEAKQTNGAQKIKSVLETAAAGQKKWTIYGWQHIDWVEITNITNKVNSVAPHVLEVETASGGVFKSKNITKNSTTIALEGFSGCHTEQALIDYVQAHGGTYSIKNKSVDIDGVFSGQPVIYLGGKEYVKINGTFIEYEVGKWGGTSSFFPDNWSIIRIKEEVAHAIANNIGKVNPGNPSSNWLRGFSKDGKIEIHFVFDPIDINKGSYFPIKK